MWYSGHGDALFHAAMHNPEDKDNYNDSSASSGSNNENDDDEENNPSPPGEESYSSGMDDEYEE